MQQRKRYQHLGLLLALSCIAGCGDVVFESDPCEQKIGANAIRFAAFQGSAWGQKACDEIPGTGPASLSVDLPDKALRSMQSGMRIIKAQSWRAAQDAGQDGQGEVILEDAARTRPTGLITLDHEFQTPGYFVEIVTLSDAGSGAQHTIRFPFRVAVGAGLTGTALGVIAGIGLSAYGVLLTYRRRRPAAPVPTNA